MQKDWIFTVENSVCDLRTVGVLIKDGKILVQRVFILQMECCFRMELDMK